MDANGIFSDLLTVEVNTIIRPNMTAEKMPSLPFALLDIIEDFAVALIKLGVDLEPYLTPSREQCWARICEDEAYLELAREAYTTANEGRTAKGDELFDFVCDLWPALDVTKNTWPTTPDWCFSMELVTNGWDSFERLRIAALQAAPELTAGAEVLIMRIVSACSRIKYIVQGMQQRYVSDPDGQASGSRLSLRDRVAGRKDRFASWQDLVPKTRNQLLRRGERDKAVPVHRMSAEDQSLVRKIWELGTDSVVAQTCVQIDGDVITRISEQLIQEHALAVQRLVLDCHHMSINTGLTHWRSLVQVAIELINNVLGKTTSR